MDGEQHGGAAPGAPLGQPRRDPEVDPLITREKAWEEWFGNLHVVMIVRAVNDESYRHGLYDAFDVFYEAICRVEKQRRDGSDLRKLPGRRYGTESSTGDCIDGESVRLGSEPRREGNHQARRPYGCNKRGLLPGPGRLSSGCSGLGDPSAPRSALRSQRGKSARAASAGLRCTLYFSSTNESRLFSPRVPQSGGINASTHTREGRVGQAREGSGGGAGARGRRDRGRGAGRARGRAGRRGGGGRGRRGRRRRGRRRAR